jgi:hypothetical protein
LNNVLTNQDLYIQAIADSIDLEFSKWNLKWK